MALRDILKMGDPRLQQIAEPVIEFNSPALDALILDMFDTIAMLDGAGLAAPQIGVSLRLVIFAVENNPRYPEVEPVPRTVLINPQISILDDTLEQGWEGCLSLPGLRGLVPRYRTIRYSGYDQCGNFFEREACDFHARVVLHEVDHLDGILYPQRIQDLRNFGFESALFPESQAKTPENTG
ncbi:Peptide deformylase [hydrothermal vent metagenome]|uniref:Peptide deformylase n=1 Tax=hydrothermal vent metagenome TaxID=652676 RepID=A0A3B1BSF6_9ZZZZ